MYMYIICTCIYIMDLQPLILSDWHRLSTFFMNSKLFYINIPPFSKVYITHLVGDDTVSVLHFILRGFRLTLGAP